MDRSVVLFKMSHLGSLFYKSNANVISLHHQIHQGRPTILTLLDNNSIIVQDQSSEVRSIIYPPPKSKQVMALLYSDRLERVIVVLESGTLCVYSIHGTSTAFMETLIELPDMKDRAGRAL